jgi:HJR/Mrr/RecB family endonuclease
MSYVSLRQEPSQLRMSQPLRQNLDRAGRPVPLIPRWVQRCGAFFLVPALSVIVVRGHAGLVYGADRGWTLLAAAGSILVALLWFCYAWRQTRPERALRRMSKFTSVDRMSGRQFEKYCIRLLQARGYRIVAWTGGTRNDHGFDIIAISPRGAEVAIQCKRQKDKLGPDVIRELIGATASGLHKGRARMVMTNAFVTDGARACAIRSRIKVVDRPELQNWMDRVRSRLDQRRARRTNLITLVTLLMAGALCSAAIAIRIVVDQAATHPHSTAPAPDSLSAADRSLSFRASDLVAASGDQRT